VVGSLSGGVDCGAEGIPDVYKSYLDVTHDWIRNTILEKFPLKPFQNESSPTAPASDTTDQIAAETPMQQSSETPADSGPNYRVPSSSLLGSFGNETCVPYIKTNQTFVSQ